MSIIFIKKTLNLRLNSYDIFIQLKDGCAHAHAGHTQGVYFISWFVVVIKESMGFMPAKILSIFTFVFKFSVNPQNFATFV